MKKYGVVLVSLISMVAISGCSGSTAYLKDGAKALEKGKYSEAVDCFDKMIEIESEKEPESEKKNKIWSNNMSEAYKGLGIAYFETKDYEKALEAYLESIKLEGEKSASMYRNIAVCAKETGNTTMAEEYAKKGVELLNDSKEENTELKKDMYIILIESFEADGNYKEALNWAYEYDEAFPGDKDIEKEIKFLKTR